MSMSYNNNNSEGSSLPSSPAVLIGFAGLTHQQAMDHQYPVAPLEPGCEDGGPYYLGTDTGPWGSARLVPLPPPLSTRQPPHHRPHSSLSGLANCDRIVDPVARGNKQLSIPFQAQAPALAPSPSGVRLPAAALSPPVQSGAPVEPDPVATPNPARAALMARLTNEAMSSKPDFGTRQQLAALRAMPIRRQLSLRDNHDDFRRKFASYWVAAAAYVVGDVAAVPCSQCERGNGIFSECVVVRQPGENPQPLSGVCAGCYYGNHAFKCTFHGNFFFPR
ncbi:hypothetical protein DSL72_001653 [Monilinia vaccinii-corymbosi]|uniref:Uncharacterized protein n=1 Tax=Monilinia vaccinii-corymbosi TaxID=61207 RepID=A0A8A3P6A2_9HELO|nr:hypothetical protein DSL72_001653 [Monilinia vaccinii-corymbosi]